LLVAFLLTLLQANLYRVLWAVLPMGATPSLVLPLVVFLGVHEHSMARGALLAAAIGYLQDLLGSAPVFLFTFCSVSVWWLSRIAGVRLAAQTGLTRIPLAFLFAVTEGALVLVLLAVFGNDTRRPIEIAPTMLMRALLTAAVSPPVFWLAQRLQQGGVAAGSAGEAGQG